VANQKAIYIGSVIRKLRKSKLMSQEDLAEESKLGLRTITAIEGNKQEPLLSTLYSLALGLDIDILDLVVEIKKEI